MQPYKKWTIIRRITMIASIALLLLLIGFLVLPIQMNYPEQLNQLGLQRSRSQRIAKDVYALAYRPLSEQAQATNELQITLPAWEKEQAFLQTVPVRDDIHLLLIQSQPDFLAVDIAAHNVLKDSVANRRPDPVQVQIIADHERAYFLTINQVMTLVTDRLQDGTVALVTMQLILVGISILLTVAQSIQAERLRSLLIRRYADYITHERMVDSDGNPLPQESPEESQ